MNSRTADPTAQLTQMDKKVEKKRNKFGKSQKNVVYLKYKRNNMKIKNNHEDIRANKKENVRYIEQVKMWENDREKCQQRNEHILGYT